MPRIVLKDQQSGKTHSVHELEATIGRDPASAIVIAGENSKVVSGRHALIYHVDDAWWIEDTSRNGTILDDERLRKGVRSPLQVGQLVGLGESGPRLQVVALDSRQVAETMVEAPANVPGIAQPRAVAQAAKAAPAPAPAPQAGAAAAAASPMRRNEPVRANPGEAEESTEPAVISADWIAHVVLREVTKGQRWDVRGDPVKLGRAHDCLVQVPPEHGASVSRVHAEILIDAGGVQIRDAGSRNGTYVNGERLRGPVECKRSDTIMLGAGGPTFTVEDLHIVKSATSKTKPNPALVRPSTPASADGKAAPVALPEPRRTSAAIVRAALLKDVAPAPQQGPHRVRTVIWVLTGVAVLVAAYFLGTLN